MSMERTPIQRIMKLVMEEMVRQQDPLLWIDYPSMCCVARHSCSLFNEVGDGEAAGGAENNEPGLEEDDEANGGVSEELENNEPALEEDEEGEGDGKPDSFRPPKTLCSCELT
jgi:hypothetical protein